MLSCVRKTVQTIFSLLCTGGIFQFELKEKVIAKMTSPPDSCWTVSQQTKHGNSHPDRVKHRGMKGGENSDSERSVEPAELRLRGSDPAEAALKCVKS